MWLLQSGRHSRHPGFSATRAAGFAVVQQAFVWKRGWWLCPAVGGLGVTPSPEQHNTKVSPAPSSEQGNGGAVIARAVA